MKLLLSSLLLTSLCTLSSWSVSSSTFVVTQTPDVSVMEGETINITCCWTEKFERFRVQWLKNQTVIKTENSLNRSQGSLKQEAKSWSSLTLTKIRTEDSGRYICRVTVEIPSLTVATGNGTVITVTANQAMNNTSADSTGPSTTVMIPLAVVGPLLLVTLVCCCILRRKQALAARVIYEVPHIDSETAEMDKHSTNSSRGSSQWCQVPVYESFYFEQVDPKESG
ncbi:transmembrane and immunoglobulin domain-containing protein 2-like [Archocentrus centrarchus]|uniref:transmembrane and immunoglobulin domain-containing protein 2-like n=1 Tax=Archocentrus centrarchus TaxID=63155 RepID=UPI0011E9DED9|nr:transmembrane and immunoglobulin domain-containing protein 2-like [Archocentrus centrarchus]